MTENLKRRNKMENKSKHEIPAGFPLWTDLPSDLTASILQRLGSEEILRSAQFVCTTWRNVCLNPALWREINFINRCYPYKELAMMCRRAVDRSQGQLIHLTIAYFGDDALLHYIADRSSRLRCLKLAFCSKISATTLIEAFKKLHELEELHLIVPSISSGDIGSIGDICPMLKSFTHTSFSECNYKLYRLDSFELPHLDRNELALAIAKSMPNLHHLGLIGNGLSEEGLQSILDGCPRLESLDLRQCIGVDLGGAIGERCRKQMKHLRLPTDSIDDYEWDDIINDGYSSGSPYWGSFDDGYESFDDYSDCVDPRLLDFYGLQ